jgi:pyridinium-3,5-bisthiocarboxylic acid mononucleotide nickel chelatase
VKIAYLDIISGICGDMTLGAFIHAGVPFDVLKAELARLDLHGYTLAIRKIERSMISATKVDVMVDAGHDHPHEHDADEHHDHHEHRSYRDIVDLIRTSNLSKAVQQTSLDIFKTIGLAEAAVHEVALEEIHFHEVGAVDSIVDIVGTAICLDQLGIEAVYTNPVPMGSNGFINTRHGVMPIPAPATVEILKGYPVVLKDIQHELTTPTGAAIVKTLSKGTFDRPMQMHLNSIGYGAGSDELPGMPNMLRVLIGKIDAVQQEDELLLIETNIDDMNPQFYPFLMERALAMGVNDIFVTPILMKKGRPGHLVTVLCVPALQDDVLNLFYTETTTLGVRISAMRRSVLPRETILADTSLGRVAAKRIELPGRTRTAVEFEECKRVALEKGLPLLVVFSTLEKELGG